MSAIRQLLSLDASFFSGAVTFKFPTHGEAIRTVRQAREELERGRAALPPLTKVNPSQRQWLERYYTETGFEPMHLDELEAGTMTFAEVARRNRQWYEDHTNDTLRRVEDPIGTSGPTWAELT